MGLGGDLNDVSTDSIPLLLISLLATSLSLLRSAIHLLLPLPLPLPSADEVEYVPTTPLLSASASASALFPLDASPAFEYADEEGQGRVRCVVCLCRLRRGDVARRLPCSHLFHRRCVDGWVDRSNFTCPLCRAPIAPAVADDCRAGGDLVAWFAQPARRWRTADPDSFVGQSDRQDIVVN